MLPAEGGYYAWVRRAFGEFWAFQNGWWTWMYSLVDMAIYPVLFNQYLAFFFPDLNTPTRWTVSLAMIWSTAAVNLHGVKRVGLFSVVAGGGILGAFGLLALGAMPHVTHAPWVPFAISGKNVSGNLSVGLSIALWNYVGWDNASTVQGEVVDASRSYPAADVLLYSLALFLEFAALVHFRRNEPDLRGVFRVPVGTGGIVLLAAIPMAVLLVVIALGARDGEYAGPALLGSLAVILAGPPAWKVIPARRRDRRV